MGNLEKSPFALCYYEVTFLFEKMQWPDSL